LTKCLYFGNILRDNKNVCRTGKLFLLLGHLVNVTFSNARDKGDALKCRYWASNGRKDTLKYPMYTLYRLVAHYVHVISQARALAALPLVISATAVQAASPIAPYTMSLDTSTPQAVTVSHQPAPNFDTEVLQPLRATQAQAKARAAAEAKRAAAAKQAQEAAARAAQAATVSQTAPVVVAGDIDGLLQALRFCEAGGDYTRNSGNGYYGAYQYNIGSWASYGGYARADLAPAAVQDAKAKADIARRGWTPWPSCARRIGAM
jgi:hypothetical protein